MAPNAFVIGAMKCGTTSLCDLLESHPDLFVVKPKEPDFFSRDEVYAKGLDWYESLFKGGADARIQLDGSTSLTKLLQYPKAAERLAKHVPDAKLIYIVRNPIERMQSHWSHEVLKGRTKLNVDEFVMSHPEVVDISCYWRQLMAYREYFEESSIHVLFIEELRDEPAQTLNACFRFLGISETATMEKIENSNQSAKRKLDILPIRLLRKYRWFDVRFEQLKQKIPAGVHGPLKKIFKSNRNIESNKLRPETITWAVKQLGDDPATFLEQHGKENDYWGNAFASPKVEVE